VRVDADGGAITAQDARAGPVKRADREAIARGAEQRLQALTHLASGLIGEGDREHVVGRDALVLDQVRDAMDDDARLAGAGPGDDEQRAARGLDGFALGRVEAFEHAQGASVASAGGAARVAGWGLYHPAGRGLAPVLH
jgi:hypothetical protein